MIVAITDEDIKRIAGIEFVDIVKHTSRLDCIN